MNSVFRNLITRERIAHPLIALHTPGRRIIDHDLLARRSSQLAEIAAQEVLYRHGSDSRVWRSLSIPLETEKEKCLVAPVIELRNPNRPVDLSAILVKDVPGVGEAPVSIPKLARRDASGVGQQTIRVEEVAPGIFEDRTVKFIAARLHRHVDNAAGGPPVLSVVSIGDDLELLYGVRRRR